MRPMTAPRPVNAQSLRALSHPLRWKLISLLTVAEQATATRCAESLGETVASCSYHLNILAKYGYIEPVPVGKGKEKPWRLVRRDQEWSYGEQEQDARDLAAAATEAFLEYEFAHLRERNRAALTESADWRAGYGLTGVTMWLTLDELHELRSRLAELTGGTPD